MKVPYLIQEFSETVRLARQHGVGTSIGQIAASRPKVKGIRLSTLKAIDKGRHVRPAQLKLIARLFKMQPIDWTETKIRYVESYIGEYLVKPKNASDVAKIAPCALSTFAAYRKARIRQLRKGSATYYQDCLKDLVEIALLKANKKPMHLCAKTGMLGSKKNKSSAKYPTVTALKRGLHVRPEKLGAICLSLGLPRAELRALKIRYAEAYLGEHLLGDDVSALAKAITADQQRTASLLIFSAANMADLA